MICFIQQMQMEVTLFTAGNKWKMFKGKDDQDDFRKSILVTWKKFHSTILKTKWNKNVENYPKSSRRSEEKEKMEILTLFFVNL